MPEHTALFRFYNELNDFLKPEKRNVVLAYHFNGSPSVKDAIEANHIPHTEVDCINVNGKPAGFDYHLKSGDRVGVYPACPSAAVKLREKPSLKFILDVHLGKLARLLRMLGFDTYYDTGYDDKEIIRIALEEERIILTRDRRLLHVKEIVHGYCLRSQNSAEQIMEVIRRFDLCGKFQPFTRCLSCGGQLKKVNKMEIKHFLEPKTALYFFDFKQCGFCGKVFWKGSHFGELSKDLEKITQMCDRR